MRNYSLKREIIAVNGFEFRICSLQDVQQYDPNDSEAHEMGLSSSNWSIFGVVWPASRILAGEIGHLRLGGKRVLEIGCGIGLPSLLLHKLGTDITASDYHPRASEFLERNARDNGLHRLPFRHVDFEEDNPTLGRFDLIIASDVLYQPQHAARLARTMSSHTTEDANVIVVEPGRGNGSSFTRHMTAFGFLHHFSEFDQRFGEAARCKGRVLHFRRRSNAAARSAGLRLV